MDTVAPGIFSTRAPLRPGLIGMTIEKLISIGGSSITAGGGDMLDNTPLLDKKQYLPRFDAIT
ncbi:MAG: TrmO family methyltransferase [Ignavibacteria bacterium]|nr:TrmO family methyltransferase [Ignavibacteria bacterium]